MLSERPPRGDVAGRPASRATARRVTWTISTVPTVAAAASASTSRERRLGRHRREAALSGAATRTARLSSASRSRATSLTSSCVIPGSSARVRSYSVWMPGNGSSVVKFRMLGRVVAAVGSCRARRVPAHTPRARAAVPARTPTAKKPSSRARLASRMTARRPCSIFRPPRARQRHGRGHRGHWLLARPGAEKRRIRSRPIRRSGRSASGTSTGARDRAGSRSRGPCGGVGRVRITLTVEACASGSDAMFTSVSRVRGSARSGPTLSVPSATDRGTSSRWTPRSPSSSMSPTTTTAMRSGACT